MLSKLYVILERLIELKTKEDYAINIAGAIEQKELDSNDLLIKYAQKPRV